MSENVKIFIAGQEVGRLTSADFEGNEITSKATFEMPPRNEYEFYLRRGNNYYFRNIYSKMVIEHEALNAVDLKKGLKVKINVE